jgi:hypothetical protein
MADKKISIHKDGFDTMFEHPDVAGLRRLSERFGEIEKRSRDKNGRLNPTVARVASALLRNRMARIQYSEHVLRDGAMQARIEQKLGRKLSHDERLKLGFVTAALEEARREGENVGIASNLEDRKA